MFNAQSRRQSPRLSPPIRRRPRNRAQRLRRSARPPLFLPQSQHSRLNHRSVRVSRRKEAIREAQRGHPRHERRSRQSACWVKEKHRLNFPLLSDPTHKTIQKFGVWQKKQFMGRTFMGIVRSSFLIGKTGKIEELWPIVRAKGHASEVLKVISKKQPAARVAAA